MSRPRRAELARGRLCERGHDAWHLAKDNNYRCAACARARVDKWVKANPERAAANNKRNAKQIAARTYRRNKAKNLARALAYHRAHPERVYLANRRWVEKNKHRRAIYNATRRVAVKRATPSWVDKSAILAVYAEAQRQTKALGVRMSVDHIYPLCGIGYCGLHVSWNMKIVPFADNCRKGNRFGG